MRSYSDSQLRDAIPSSRSWRGVLRTLGLTATSASAMRSVRSHADRLGLDYSHFTGQRRWTDKQLAEAVAGSRTWMEVADTLGLSGGSSTTTIRGHAVRLGLDTGHLGRPAMAAFASGSRRPQLERLSRAGPMMAAAWFELCGDEVAWPLEPSRYDLLVWTGGKADRVQVKTATVRSGTSWTVWLSTTTKRRTPYDPDEIDAFFVINGDLEYFLIPVSAVAGRMAIQLSAYQQYRVPQCPSEPVESDGAQSE